MPDFVFLLVAYPFAILAAAVVAAVGISALTLFFAGR